jgi:translocation and assembly module TamB
MMSPKLWLSQCKSWCAKQAQQHPRVATVLRRLGKTLFAIIFILLIVVTLLTSLISTDKGSRWVLQQAANPLHAQLGDIRGNLLTGLDVASLDFAQGELQVHAEKIAFRWQPIALFYATASVQSLGAENIHIQLPPSKNEPEPDPFVWPNFSQPVRVELGNIKLRNLQIKQGEQITPITAITGSLVLGKFRLQINELTLVKPGASLVVDGTAGLGYPYKLALKSQWQYKPEAENSPLFAGEVALNGDIKKLQIDHTLQQPLLANLQAILQPALHDKKRKPGAEVTLEWPQQEFTPALQQWLNPNNDQQFLTNLLGAQGKLQLQGWLDNYHLSGQVQADTRDARLIAHVNAKGQYQAGDASGDSQPLARWQIAELRLTSQKPQANGQTSSAGLLQKIDNLIDQKIQTQDQPIDNSVQLSGDVTLLPRLQWNLQLQGEHLNLAQFVADWPSDLHVDVKTNGEQLADQQWQIAIDPLTVKGALRQYKVAAEGALKFDRGQWQGSNINVALGDNKLAFSTKTPSQHIKSDQLALEWKLTAPALHQIANSLRGTINSTGAISGDVHEPRLQITAQADQLGWGDYAVEKLLLTLNPRAASSSGSQHYDLQLDLTRAQLAGQALAQASIKGTGTLEKHRIDGQVDSPTFGHLSLGLDSSWKDNLWRGRWHELSLSAKNFPRWFLATASKGGTINNDATMEADATHAYLNKLCLTTANTLAAEVETAAPAERALQEAPSICANVHWARERGANADASLKAFPLNSLRAWFKPEVNVAGYLDGDLKWRAEINQSSVLDAKLQTRAAQLHYQFQGGKVETYELREGSVVASLKSNQFIATTTLDWANYGVIKGDAKYSLADKKIQAKLDADLPNLAPLESLLPFLNNVQGSATANLNVAGTSEKPAITGSLHLQNGSANLPRLGLELKNIEYHITSPSVNSAHVEGKITSGDGTLVTQGDFINLGAPDWYWQANVFGADIRIITQSQLTANISPNLKLHADANSIELTGSTEIPWARAALKTLPETATRVSQDAVVISQGDEIGDAKKSQPFHTNVILYFGDDVRFKGFGLDTRLTGKANVLKEENRQLFTTGFVAVDRGIYRAYGQELTIERGRLIFQGPYDNPGLDIRAVREMGGGVVNGEREGSVIAGLDIGGTLQHPKSTVFAVPAKTESEAMAMLITGKPLSQSSKDDAYAIIGAIGKLGMSQGDSMSSDIARKVGLDEVSVKADKGLQQSELWIGKYLTPKLFVHYIVGLFDQAFSLGMTYKINDRIQLEAESGKTQSFDVMYKIER